MSVEHQAYIQKEVNPILESLVTAVLLDRPDDPITYMITWLKRKELGDVGTHVQGLQSQLDTLKQDVSRLEAKLGLAGAQAGNEEDEEEDEEEDNDDDVVDDMPPPPKNKGPRTSVSAEAYGKWNQKQDFVPKEIPKSDEAKDRIKTVLGRSFLFSALDQKEIDIVVNATEEVKCDDAQRLIQQGDDGDCLFVIEEGAFDCKIKKDGEEVTVKKCEAGDAFGELALLYNCPRAASVDAVGAGTVWKLDRETFNAIVKDAAQKKREKYEKFLDTIPLLESVDKYEKSQLADALCGETAAAGQQIIKQGDPGDKFYIVEEGEAFAWKDGDTDTKLMNYKEGGFFGELALLKNDARAANVTTATDCKLLSVDRKTFNRLLGPLKEHMDGHASANY